MHRRAVIAFLVIAALTLSVAPSLAQPAGGTGPGDAIPLVGTQTGNLANGKEIWYQFFNEGNSLPVGVTLNFAPTSQETNLQASFEVYIYEKRGIDVVFNKVGMGTVSGLPLGVKYWRGSSGTALNYYLRVYNNTPGNIDYALALTGEQFPPPALSLTPSAPGVPPTAVPAVPLTPTPVAPVAPPATPTAVPPAPASPVPPAMPPMGGTSIADAIPISAEMTPVTGRVTDQHIWYKFFYNGNSLPQGVVMDFQPATVEEPTLNQNVVSFNVWTTVCNINPMGECEIQKVGAGTRSGQPGGIKYWRHSGSNGRLFYLEVFNNSPQPVGYALALTGATYPPPGFAVPAP